MAKKVASGATHVVLDVPVGPTMKIQHFTDAETIARKFSFLAKKFNIKVSVHERFFKSVYLIEIEFPVHGSTINALLSLSS